MYTFLKTTSKHHKFTYFTTVYYIYGTFSFEDYQWFICNNNNNNIFLDNRYVILQYHQIILYAWNSCSNCTKQFQKFSWNFQKIKTLGLHLNIGMEYTNGTKTNGGQKGHKEIPGS